MKILLILLTISFFLKSNCNKKDYYKILGVPKTADEAAIKKAFKKLSVKFHPDKVKGPNKKSAETRFAEIVEAYETLKDKDKRYEYDHGGPENMFGGGAGGGGGFDGFDFSSFFGGGGGQAGQAGQGRKKKGNGFNFNQNEFFGDFNIFNNFAGFGGGGGGDNGNFGFGGNRQKGRKQDFGGGHNFQQNERKETRKAKIWGSSVRQFSEKDLKDLKSTRNFWFVYFYFDDEVLHEKWNSIANLVHPYAKFGAFDCSSEKEVCKAFHSNLNHPFLYMKRNDTTRFHDDEINPETIHTFVETGIPSGFYYLQHDSIDKFLGLSGTKVIYVTHNKEMPVEIRIFAWKKKDEVKIGFVNYANEKEELKDILGITRIPGIVFLENGIKKVHQLQTLHLPEIFDLLNAFQKESKKSIFDASKSSSCSKVCLIVFNQKPDSVEELKKELKSLAAFLGTKDQENLLRENFIHEDFTAIFIKKGTKMAIMKGKTRSLEKIKLFVESVMSGDFKFMTLKSHIHNILFSNASMKQEL